MAGKIKITFHYRVLLALLGLCWLLVSAFMVFQYQREKEFRTELLDMELQMHNERILDDLRQGESIASIEHRIAGPVEGLRLTLVGADGSVLYDSNGVVSPGVSNHNNRPEVREARRSGSGYAVDRKSESDDTDYFYSATMGPGGIVVRSAAPYTHSLQTFLKADSSFLWIMLSVTFAVCMAGYFVARRISTSISRLSGFADKASRGEQIYGDVAFPHDELGNIAANIVRLYAQLDEKHQEAIRLEREKTRLKKELTNNINHELKTPVASIGIYAELLRDNPGLPEDRRREAVERICENTVRLGSLLQDVAALTRMDDGASVIVREPVNLTALVNEVMAVERLRTSMAIDIDMPELEINGNRALLESVFRNLADNAIAYSGGSRITVRADRQGNFVFRDNGAGMPPEHLGRIFERFYRIDKGRSRRNGGTGLGLAIVKNAVAIHGGTIRASLDGGLRFDFTLPVTHVINS